MLQVSKKGEVEKDENRHHLATGHCEFAVPPFLWGTLFQGMTFDYGESILSRIRRRDSRSLQFYWWESLLGLLFIFSALKIQISLLTPTSFYHFSYVELTLTNIRLVPWPLSIRPPPTAHVTSSLFGSFSIEKTYVEFGSN